MRIRLAGVVVWAITAIGCGDGAADSPGVAMPVDSAGVTIWAAPGDDRPAALRLEREGGLALPDTGWTLSPDGVAIDTRGGRIYLLDESGPRVLVFDEEGAFLGERGRAGEGPGEFRAPSALDLTADGELRILDPDLGVVHRWTADGEYVDRDPMPIPYWGPGFTVTPDGFVYTTSGGEETGTMTEALVRMSSAGEDTLFTVRSRWTPLEMPCGRVPVPEVLALSSVWDAHGDRIVLQAVPRYELRVLEGGRVETLYRRDVAPLPVGEAQAEATVAEGPLRFLVEACGMTAAGVVRGAGYVDEISPLVHVALGPTGRIWAVRGLGATVSAIDLFAPDRGYVGTLEADDEEALPVPVAFFSADRMLGLTRSEWGWTLDRWRVVPPP